MRANTYFSWSLLIPVMLPVVGFVVFGSTEFMKIVIMALVFGVVPYAILAIVLRRLFKRAQTVSRLLKIVWVSPLLSLPVVAVFLAAILAMDGSLEALEFNAFATMVGYFVMSFLIFGYGYVLIAVLGFFVLRKAGYIQVAI